MWPFSTESQLRSGILKSVHPLCVHGNGVHFTSIFIVSSFGNKRNNWTEYTWPVVKIAIKGYSSIKPVFFLHLAD